MLVCHCNVVTDREIREAIACGARDEFDVAGMCGAGTGCGGCLETVSRLLADAHCTPGCPVGQALRSARAGTSARSSEPVRAFDHQR